MAAPVNVRPSRPVRWGPRAGRPGGAGRLLAGLVLASLSLMLLDVRGGPTDALRGLGAAVGGPLESASSGLFGSIVSPALRRPDVAGLEQRISDLEALNQSLQLSNDSLTEQLAGRADARAAGALATALHRTTVAAQVVAESPGLAAGAVTIDAGSDDGVEPDSAVLVPAGLVGRVVSVSASTSSVRLITDPASAVAVRLRGARQVGLLRGTGDRHRLSLGYVDPMADIRTGDVAVTLGSPGEWPFPAGIPVGPVSAVSGATGDVGRTVTVIPAADLSALDHVVVLTRPGDSATADAAGAAP